MSAAPTTLQAEIDGLYAECAKQSDMIERSRVRLLLECVLVTSWPTISAALAEAEEMRRKAKAFDYITACHMHYDGRVYAFNGFTGAETGAGKNITAALAAKEQSNG